MVPYFHDDGTEFNPNLIPTPSLCATCKKNDDPKHETPCNLIRADQDEDIFMCFAYESISGKDKTTEILQEMKDYMDHKYGKHGEKRKG